MLGFSLALAISCSTGSTGNTVSLAAAAAGPNSGSCSQSGSGATGSGRYTLSSGGIERDYLLSVPSTYTGDRAVPVVLDFHGFGGTATQQDDDTGLSVAANAAGMIVVTPDATGKPQHWLMPYPHDPMTMGRLDPAFVSDLLANLRSKLCLDPARTYAAGFSEGAALVSWLPCALSGRFAAIAPIESTLFAPTCHDAPPVSVIAFHGTADETIPYGGGRMLGTTEVPPVEDTVARWAALAGCARAPTVVPIGDAGRLLRYPRCGDRREVELYAVAGGTHEWPKTSSIDATSLIVDFFSSQPGA